MPLRRRGYLQRLEDPPDRGCAGPVAGLDQFALDPLVWPAPRSPHSAVGPVQAGPRIGAAQHGDLVPEHQELGVLGGGWPAEQDQPAADLAEDEIEQTEGHGRSSWPTEDPAASLQLTGSADF